MSLLAQREAERAAVRTALYETTRTRLRAALHQVAPGHAFWLFGSLVDPRRFNPKSDVDLAFTTLPAGMTEFALAGELQERLGRSVDVVDFEHSRLRSKIEREGERWIA